jgi:hypothetical protein
MGHLSGLRIWASTRKKLMIWHASSNTSLRIVWLRRSEPFWSAPPMRVRHSNRRLLLLRYDRSPPAPQGRAASLRLSMLNRQRRHSWHGRELRQAPTPKCWWLAPITQCCSQIGTQQVALAPSLANRITLDDNAALHAARHAAWRRCSAFWSCVRGEPHVCPINDSLESSASILATP